MKKKRKIRIVTAEKLPPLDRELGKKFLKRFRYNPELGMLEPNVKGADMARKGRGKRRRRNPEEEAAPIVMRTAIHPEELEEYVAVKPRRPKAEVAEEDGLWILIVAALAIGALVWWQRTKAQP